MTNTELAELSDTLLITAIGAYAVAMVGYTVEYAFGAKGAVASRVKAQLPKQRALATVGGGTPDTSADVPTPPAEEPSAKRGKSARFGVFAIIATIVGALAQVACLTTRGLSTDRVPWGNMYEFISAVCLAGVVAWLVLAFTKPVRHLGMFVLLPVVLLLGLAGTVLYAEAAPLMPALNSFWLKIHVSTAALASGVFLTGFVTAALYLIRERYERRIEEWAVQDAKAAVSGMAENSADDSDESEDADTSRELRFPLTLGPRLPSSETLERLTFRIHALAFPIWTFAIVAGAIWAEAAWTRYWGWDPKETWAFISWVIYAAYLHARSTNGWRGAKSMMIVLAGWASMMVNLFVINLVTSGLHSYSGVS
ncbi:MAG: c-type cytochrome biogenesis protein CcsB [Corynebacteriales bacterium]|nr:c-type cytochrome biogenesis protein CcsB [Mycobacteriales bacterium]